MKEQLFNILNEVRPDIDYEIENKLLSNEIFDSFDIMVLIAELTEKFLLDISAEDISYENFDSIESILNMIYRKREIL